MNTFLIGTHLLLETLFGRRTWLSKNVVQCNTLLLNIHLLSLVIRMDNTKDGKQVPEALTQTQTKHEAIVTVFHVELQTQTKHKAIVTVFHLELHCYVLCSYMPARSCESLDNHSDFRWCFKLCQIFNAISQTVTPWLLTFIILRAFHISHEAVPQSAVHH